MVVATTMANLADLGALVLVGIVRVLWAFSYIALHPFAVHLANFQLDWLDGGVAAQMDLSRTQYEYVDKSLDLYYYIVVLIYLSVNVYELWYAKYGIAFLVWRIVGNIIFLITLEPFVLVIFANVFQLFFLLYTFLDIIQVDAYVRDTPLLNGGLLAIVTAIKYVAEGLFHDEVLPDPADDDHICQCDTAWLWLESYLWGTVIILVFAMYIGLTHVANFAPPRKPQFPHKPMGWDLVDGKEVPKPWLSPYNISLRRNRKKASKK
jgi:hypothetical protein